MMYLKPSMCTHDAVRVIRLFADRCVNLHLVSTWELSILLGAPADWSALNFFKVRSCNLICCRYLVAAHSAPNQFVAVVGNSTLDFNYYGPVCLHTLITGHP